MRDSKIKVQIVEARCPNGHSLMSDEVRFNDKPSILVSARVKGASGPLYLSSFFGDFRFQTPLALKEGDIVNLTCPECGVTLSIDEHCRLCKIPMFAVHLPDGGQVEACPKIGCHNHKLTLMDLDKQFLRFYTDETQPKM